MSIEKILDRAASDPTFGDRFLADPLGAARSAGITLTASEAEEAKTMLSKAKGGGGIESLQPRVSRMGIPLGAMHSDQSGAGGHAQPGQPGDGHGQSPDH